MPRSPESAAAHTGDGKEERAVSSTAQAGSCLQGCLQPFRGVKTRAQPQSGSTPPHPGPGIGDLTGPVHIQPRTGAGGCGLAAEAGGTSPRQLTRQEPEHTPPTVGHTHTLDGKPAPCSRAPASWKREAIQRVWRLSCPSMPKGPRLDTPNQPRPQHPHLPEAPSSLPPMGPRSKVYFENCKCSLR